MQWLHRLDVPGQALSMAEVAVRMQQGDLKKKGTNRKSCKALERLRNLVGTPLSALYLSHAALDLASRTRAFL
jgi:hypothetical protein